MAPGSVSRSCSSSGTAAVKGWCDGVPALVLVVPLEQREVDDEGEVADGVVDQFETAAEFAAEGVEDFVRFVLAVGDDEQHVAAVGTGRAGHLARLLLGEELARPGTSRLPSLACRCSLRRRSCIETRPRPPYCWTKVVRSSTCLRLHVGAAGYVEAADDAAAADDVAEDRELGVAEDIVEVDELHTEAEVGLVAAVALHRFVVGDSREGVTIVQVGPSVWTICV